MCSAVPRSSSSSVVGWGKRPQWVEEASGPMVLAKNPPFNHPLGDLLKACSGREQLFEVWQVPIVVSEGMPGS